MAATVEQEFQQLRAGWEEEFSRQKKLHRRRINCRPGCDDCCRRLFAISELEAAEISRAVRQVPIEQQTRLRERARQYLEQRRQLLAVTGWVDSRGSLPPPNVQLECPALENGRCSLYESRPLSCRKYGAVLIDAKDEGRVFACEKNFRPGESLSDALLEPRQATLIQLGRAVEARYDRAGGRRHDEPLTVAHAIVEDLDELLPKAD